ncbi:helix-turn-helix transcriptional regulator [Dyadobacter sp. 676]|uniref:Helix-turn-helix transcriptional regulator n=1 Tax=Dyadobacter sp. 676 TaxID=3088362 RepID=A0AAU8FKJ0_9BACT
MTRPPIGLIIKTIIKQKNLSPTRIARDLGISKQQVYNTYVRASLQEGEIDRWAEVLGVSVDELVNYQFEPSNGSDADGSSEVLDLIKKMFEQELKEKNEQIRALQENLRASQEALKLSQQMQSVLLGKSPEYSDRSIIPLHRNRIQALAGV